MSMTDREIMQQALTALTESKPIDPQDNAAFVRSTKAIEALIKALAQPEPVVNERDGSPCPEFWDWLPKAYNFEGNGTFTKYNMEIAFLAGKNTALAQPEFDTPESHIVKWSIPVDPNNFGEPLAQPEQEPVAWAVLRPDGRVKLLSHQQGVEVDLKWTPLYTTSPRKPWVGLTQEEVQEIAKQLIDDAAYCSTHFAIAIEAELRRKNNAV